MNARTFSWVGRLAVVALAGVLSASCANYPKQQARADAWLAAQTAKPEINVSGLWTAPNWGAAQLRQAGRNVSGTLDRYSVSGVVSGRRAYLVLSEGGWPFYTAVLQPRGRDYLVGKYSESVPFSEAGQVEMLLQRVP